MSLSKRIKQALGEACRRAGNQARLAEKTGVSYAIINRFAGGQRDIGNMTVKTLERLFPELTVSFFPDEPASAHHIGMANRNSGTIVNGDNHGTITLGNGASEGAPPGVGALRDLIVDCAEISDRAKIQIFKILKEDRL